MKFLNPYFSEKEKIELLQRWILVQSYLYYEMDSSIVSDYVFDRNCVQLVRLSRANPKALKRSNYYYAMKDFDGSTGYGYFDNLNPRDSEKIMKDAVMILDLVRKGGQIEGT